MQSPLIRLAAGSAWLALAALATAGPLQAQQPANFGAQFGPVDPRVEVREYVFKPTGETLKYGLFVSSRVKKGRKAPLIVALHGLGGTFEAMLRENFHTVDLAEEHGYILVAPMGYNTSGWYGIPLSANPTPQLARQSEYSEQDVMDVLAMVREEFTVDADRIYLMGHSMGGAGALYLGIKHPSVWAALAPIAPAAGGLLDPASLASIRSMPVIIVQGDADTAVPVDGTRRWVEKLKELRMNHKYDEFAGGTHMGVIGPGMADIFAFFDAASRATH